MNGGMTGASSNIGCLEALPRVALLQLAQSGLRASLYIVYKRLYTLGYTKVQYTLVCIRGGSISGSSMFCCFTQWTTSQGLSWHMSLCLHSIYHREAPAPSTFSTMKILWLFTIITSLQSLQSCMIIMCKTCYPDCTPSITEREAPGPSTFSLRTTIEILF